jgi:WD40 repeat protein
MGDAEKAREVGRSPEMAPDDDHKPVAPASRTVQVQQGDYAEGNIDKRIGAFVQTGAQIEGHVIGHADQVLIQETERSYHVGGLPNPYLGLQSFTYTTRARYAGRERTIAQAVGQLTAPGQQRALLFITGASGSGKSSFAQAGLLPALETFYDLRQQQVRWAVVRPASQPLDSMIDVLKQLGLTAHALNRDAILMKPGRLAQFIRYNTPPQQINVVVIDQFEELFTQSNAPQRDALFTLLAALPAFAELRSHIIATMRADYLPELFEQKVLYDIAKQGIELRAMDEPELQEAIRRPLRVLLQQLGRPIAEKRFEDALVARLARETAEDAAYLPLLQVTLEDLWAGGQLMLSAYDQPEAYSSLVQAVRRRAEHVYGSTVDATGQPQRRPAADQALMMAIFLDLLEVSLDDDGRRDVRRRRSYEDLWRDSADRARLIEDLCNARLLIRTVERAEGGGVEIDVVDIIHETLIRNWDRLREMIAEQRHQLQQRARFEQALSEWVSHSHTDDYLLDGIRLAEARELEQQGDIALRQPQAQQLLRLSVVRRERLRQRQLRRARIVAGTLALLLLMALAAAAYAWQQRRIAQSETDRAEISAAKLTVQLRTSESQRLAFIATSVLGKDPEAALLLAYEGLARERNPISEQALRDALDSALFVPTVLHGQSAAVFLARFSPDGQHVLTASSDGTAHLWDRAGKQAAEFEAHMAQTAAINIAFSPNGQRIVAAANGNIAKVYDLAGNQVAVLRGHSDAIASVAFSPDGRRVLTGSNDGTARLWDVRGAELATLPQHQGQVAAVAFSPDGILLCTGAQDGKVLLWSDSGELRKVFDVGGQVMNLVFSPDGRQIVVGTIFGSQLLSLDGEAKQLSTSLLVSRAAFSSDGSLIVTGSQYEGAQLWSNDGQPIATLRHNASVNAVAFSHDDSLIITGGNDGTTRVWDRQGSQLLIISGHTNAVLDASFSPDDRTILTSSTDGTARLWTYQGPPLPILEQSNRVGAKPIYSPDGKHVLTLTPKRVMLWERDGKQVANLKVDEAEANFTSMRFSPTGQLILTESSVYKGPTTIKLWGLDGQLRAHFTTPKPNVRVFSFSPDGQRLLVGDKGESWLIDLEGHVLSSLRASYGVFSPDGQRLLIGSSDGSAQLVETSGRSLVSFSGHTSATLELIFGADGQRVLTSSQDGTARLWDLDGHAVQTFNHGKPVYQADLSPDGQYVVTAGQNDPTPRLWRAGVDTYTPLVGHTGYISSIMFSRNGQLILTASADKTARLWDLNGQTVAVLKGHRDALDGASFSPDGRRVLTGALAGEARQYLVEPQDLLAVAACRVGRGLTKDEIERYQVGQPQFDLAQRQCPPVLN